MGTKWNENRKVDNNERVSGTGMGNKVGTRTQKWDKTGNKVGTRTQKWDKSGNKVGTRTQIWDKNGEQSGNKIHKK